MKCLVYLFFLISFAQLIAQQKSVQFDASVKSQKINLLIGTNAGPEATGGLDEDFTDFFKEIGIKSIRAHDFYGPCDWWTIFPNWNADANDSNSYNFTDSDKKIAKIVNSGFEVLFRLGTSWRGNNPLPINDPPGTIRDSSGNVIHVADTNDFKKFAEICKHIIMHYNEGWKNGHKYNIKKWEIWNEPTLKEQFWSGTFVQFFKMFSIVAKKIKEAYPNLEIGGPGQADLILSSDIQVEKDFIKYCHDNQTPLDFYSYHSYGGEFSVASPYDIPKRYLSIKSLLENNNYLSTKIICDEWNAQGNEKNFSNTGKGAAFYASTMAYSVYYNIPEIYQYRADNHPMGLLDQNLTPKIAAESMKAWVNLNQNSILLKATNAYDTLGFTSIGTVDDNENRILILASNYRNTNHSVSFAIDNFKDKNTRWKLIRKLINNTNRLKPIDTTLISQVNNSLNFSISLDGESVQQLELSVVPLDKPSMVKLKLPLNNSIQRSDSVVFYWNTSTPEVTNYHLELYAVDKLILSDTAITDTTKFFVSNSKDSLFKWRVRAYNASGWSSWSEFWYFKINKKILSVPSDIVLLSPTDSSEINDNKVTFIWAKGNNNTEFYNLEVQIKNNTFINDTSIVDTIFQLSTLQVPGEYKWRVRGKNKTGWGNWSRWWYFKTIEKESDLPKEVTLLSPADFSNIVGDKVALIWAKGNNNTTKYNLELKYKDNTFINDTNIIDTLIKISSLQVPGEYKWRVRGKNKTGWGNWSRWWYFKTIEKESDLPKEVTLLSPADFSNIVGDKVTLIWAKGNNNTTKYNLELKYKDNTFINDTNIIDTLIKISSLQVPGEYKWRVRAANQYGWGNWSVYNVFFTKSQTNVFEPEHSIIHYPNPANSTVWIDLQTQGEVTIIAIDLLGRVNQLWSGYATTGKIELYVSSLATGFYSLSIIYENKVEVIKIIKE